MLVTTATQEAEIKRNKASLGKIVHETHHKKWLAEWLKVWVLCSNPSTTKKRETPISKITRSKWTGGVA
jgi:hypothetical protein